MVDVVTLGETMVLFHPEEEGPFAEQDRFYKKIGGAESNVAIGLARLGHQSGWVSKLGDDPMGRYVCEVIEGEGVDTTHVKYTDRAPTGMMVKEIDSADDARVYYYRHGSAASTITTEDLPRSYIRQSELFHVTGITPLLSESCQRAVLQAFEVAEDGNTVISFDPNIRDVLWEDATSRQVLRDCISRSNIVKMNIEEAEILFDTGKPKAAIDRVLQMGADRAAVTLGKHGAAGSDGDSYLHLESPDMDVVDTVGAGDAFQAGFLSAVLEGSSLKTALHRGNIAGALAVTVPGDMEGLPDRQQLFSYEE